MKTLSLFVTYFGAVLEGVKAVEDQFKSEPGASKAKLVLDSIQAAASVAGAAIPEAHVQFIANLINVVVASLNATGIFTHASSKPAAAKP